MNATAPSIAIVGGSLVGPTLALMLNHAGFEDVAVYDAIEPHVSPVGGVIGLDYETLGMFDDLGVDQGDIVPFPSEKVTLLRYEDGDEIVEQRFFAGRNTTWNRLHDTLSQHLPDGFINYGRRVTNVHEDTAGATLVFDDGTTRNADVVVFADGRKSTGRKLFQPHRTLNYAGYVAHRGQLPCPVDELCDFTRFQPPPEVGGQFNVFPVVMADGNIGVDWVLFTNMDEDTFRAFYGGRPTVRTFVQPHQISDAAIEYVDRFVDRIVPGDIAGLVHATTNRFAVPIVDIAAPTEMVHWLGDSACVLLGDALAPQHPNTATGLTHGLNQARGLTTGLRQVTRHGASMENMLNGFRNRYLPRVAETLQRGPKNAASIGLGLGR